MSDATEKNFKIIQNVMNEQAREIADLKQKMSFLEGRLAMLAADIANTKQMNAHLVGRGMGSTVHN